MEKSKVVPATLDHFDKTSIMDHNLLDKGVTTIHNAVEADNREDYDTALGLYQTGLKYLLAARKYEKNERTKAIIQQKIDQYLTRAEELAEKLKHPTAEKKKKKPEKIGERGDSDDDETEKLKASLSNAIVMETPNVKWDDVAGLDNAKALLKEAVLLPIKFPKLFQGKRKPWKGILLYGPPGTGKSYIAKAVATEAGASTFFAVSSSDLVSKYLGESERLVKNLFELARAKQPAIIFIDEIDSLCGSRSDGDNDSTRRIKTEFLVQMQGVGKSNDGVLVLGATNTPWSLDPAVRRRFEKRIYIPLPDLVARNAIFKIHMKGIPHTLEEQDFKYLADQTEGFSGSDIAIIVRDAMMGPVRFLLECTHFKKVWQETTEEGKENCWKYEPCSPGDPNGERKDLMEIKSEDLKCPEVTLSDFVQVLRVAKPSVSTSDIQKQIDWTNLYGQEG
jgi:vacuolar protein-sorting-associated protein 4